MDGAWADDDEESVVGVCAIDDCGSLFSGGQDGLLGAFCLADLVLEEIWSGKGVVTADCTKNQQND